MSTKMFSFKGEKVWFIRKSYRTGDVALQLECEEGPFMICTSWIPGLVAGEVAIKDYSENEGALAFVIECGVCRPPHRHIGMWPICFLVDGFFDE